MALIAAAALVAGCQCGVPAATGDGGTGSNTPPSARILSPADGALLSGKGPFPLVGDGTDAEDGPLSGAALAWSSDLDGPLGGGASLSANLRAGTHRLTLDVIDSGGLQGRAQISVTVATANRAPVVTITQPADQAYVDQGTQVQLQGSAVDPEEGALSGASLSWSSDKSGALGTGTALTITPTVVGAHRIVLTGTDSAGNTAYASITLNVVLPGANKPPVVTITEPLNNAQVALGASVSLVGSATDPEDGALTGTRLSWSSSRDGALGTGGTRTLSTLSQGAHVLTLTATDTDGLAASASVNLSVNAPNNQAPTATITAPSNNHTTFQGTAIVFTGTGSDPEDGALSGAALAWSSSVAGALGTGGSLSVSTLAVGTHQIRLTATDSGNNTGVASIQVTVLPQNRAPTVSITSPSNAASFTAGTTVQLRGSASDPEDGALFGNALTWRSDAQGVLGSGAQLDTASLTVGQHQLSLTAVDSGGRSASASVTVNITPSQAKLPPVARLSGSTQGQVGQALSFSGAGSSDSDGTIVEYRFQFGDGTAAVASASSTATHAFAAAGSYTVALTVKDSDGLTHTTSMTVVISSGPRVPTVVDARADRLGSECELAAEAGAVQVAFRNDTHPGLWFGVQSGGSFSAELVDGMGFNVGGQVGAQFAMAVAFDGTPHLAYRRLNQGLFYASKGASGWTFERADSVGLPASMEAVSIALNPAAGNQPAIVYVVDPSYERVVVAQRTGPNTWTRTQLTFSFTAYAQWLTGDVLFDAAGNLYLPLAGYTYLGRWNGTTAEAILLPGAWSGWTSTAWRSAGKLSLITGSGVMDVTINSTFTSSTTSTSLAETFTTRQHAIAADATGSPRLLVNHGSELELVTVDSEGFWARESLGATDDTRVDVTVDSGGQTRACFFRTGKLVLY